MFQVSSERSERVLRELCCYSAVCLGFDGFVMVRSDLARIDVMCCDLVSSRFDSSLLLWNALLSLLLNKGKHGLQRRKREETGERGRLSRPPGPSYPLCGSHRPCRCQQGWLHVAALSVTGAMCRRRLPVMALHSVLADIMVN